MQSKNKIRIRIRKDELKIRNRSINTEIQRDKCWPNHPRSSNLPRGVLLSANLVHWHSSVKDLILPHLLKLLCGEFKYQVTPQQEERFLSLLGVSVSSIFFFEVFELIDAFEGVNKESRG